MQSNLTQRVITALIGAGAAVSAIYFSPLGVWLFGVIVSIAGTREFWKLFGLGEGRYRWPATILLGIAWMILLLRLLAITPFEFEDLWAFYVLLLVIPLGALLAIFDQNISDPVRQISILAMGTAYAGLPFFLFFEISVPDEKVDYLPMVPLGMLLLTWTLDTGAYFSGRFLGKRKLFERISPKKTWEGAIGGGLLCLAGGFILQEFAPSPILNWIVVASIMAVLSQFGDLVESMFKRSVKIKDSGGLLPGHGGMLDRFDGFIFSMPFIFFYVFAFAG